MIDELRSNVSLIPCAESSAFNSAHEAVVHIVPHKPHISATTGGRSLEHYVGVTQGAAAKDFVRQIGHWTVAALEQQIGWPTEPCLVEFRGHTLALIPEDDEHYPAIACNFPLPDKNDDARRLIQHFLSSLAWVERRAINIESWGGGSRLYRMGKSRFRQLASPHGVDVRYLPDPTDQRARLALALYREALGLAHPAYAFLSFYKIINLVAGPKYEDQKHWLSAHIVRVDERAARERLNQLNTTVSDIGEYLYVSGRCAVAHAGMEPTVDPESSEDQRRLTADLPLIAHLAEIGIEETFGIRTAQTVWEEHHYETAGFEQLLGHYLAKRLGCKESIPRRRIPALPRLSFRIQGKSKYLPLEDMAVFTNRAIDGELVLEAISTTRRIFVMFAVDIPERRLIIGPVGNVQCRDDGSADAMVERAELQRFAIEFLCNGCLEVWSGDDTLIARKDAYMALNVDLGRTVDNWRRLEEQFRSTAESRRASEQGKGV